MTQFLRQGGPRTEASGLSYGWAGASLKTVNSYLGQHRGQFWALLCLEGTSGYSRGHLPEAPPPTVCFLLYTAEIKGESSREAEVPLEAPFLLAVLGP